MLVSQMNESIYAHGEPRQWKQIRKDSFSGHLIFIFFAASTNDYILRVILLQVL